MKLLDNSCRNHPNSTIIRPLPVRLLEPLVGYRKGLVLETTSTRLHFPVTAVDRKRFHMRLPTRAHGDGQRPGRLRGMPQAGDWVLFVQGLWSSILRGVHREVRASVPELRLKAGLGRPKLPEPEILGASPAGSDNRSPRDNWCRSSGLLH